MGRQWKSDNKNKITIISKKNQDSILYHKVKNKIILSIRQPTNTLQNYSTQSNALLTQTAKTIWTCKPTPSKHQKPQLKIQKQFRPQQQIILSVTTCRHWKLHRGTKANRISTSPQSWAIKIIKIESSKLNPPQTHKMQPSTSTFPRSPKLAR